MSYTAVETSQRSGAPIELYKFTIGTGIAYWLTSSDLAVSLFGDTYTPESVSRAEIQQNGEADQGSVEVTLPRSHPVASYFIPYSPEPAMALTVYRKHRSDPAVTVIFSGTVASALFSGSSARLTCLPIFASLRGKLPRNTCQAQCNWALYSAQCGVTRSAFQLAGTISTISGDTIQATAFSSKPAGWFNNGYVERSNGERRWIVLHAGAVLTLMSPFLSTLVVGEVVTAFAGCDRTETDCNTKFSNIARHLGFSRVPTKNPFGVAGVS